MSTTRKPRPYEHLHAGNPTECAIRFALWANGRRSVSAKCIQDFLGCHRSTAYRYLTAFTAAKGAMRT